MIGQDVDLAVKWPVGNMRSACLLVVEVVLVADGWLLMRVRHSSERETDGRTGIRDRTPTLLKGGPECECKYTDKQSHDPLPWFQLILAPVTVMGIQT